jgi:hypothetical protein
MAQNDSIRKRRGTHLDSGLVAFQPDDLTDEVVVADTHELVHCSTRHALGNDDCTREYGRERERERVMSGRGEKDEFSGEQANQQLGGATRLGA